MTDPTQPPTRRAPAPPPEYAPPGGASAFPPQGPPQPTFPPQYAPPQAAPAQSAPHSPQAPRFAPPPAPQAWPVGPPLPTRPERRNGLALASFILAGLVVLTTATRIGTEVALTYSTDYDSFDLFLTAQTGLSFIEGILALTALVLAIVGLRPSAPSARRWAAWVAIGVAAPSLLYLAVSLIDVIIWYF